MISGVTLSGRSALPQAARHCEEGFTLLEIMVVMVVLAMIVTTAFGALRLGERSWEAGLARASETEKMRTVSGLLQRQFNQILPLTWSADSQMHLAFSGTREQVRFIAPAPQHEGATGLFEFTLAIESHEGGAHLVLYYQLHNPDSTGFQPEDSDRQRILLVDELKTATFAYYGSPSTEDPPQWHSQWSVDAEAFPQLVHARLAASTEQQQWPELFLALHTELTQ
jgi:general secretion pathway protein J